jgi:MFS family permease
LPNVQSSRAGTIVFFIALLASALVLGPALAHVAELPNKIDLPREEYFIVQKLYRGWNQIAWLLGVQIVALLAAAILARAERRVMVLTLLALASVLAAQALFWTFTYPANVATANWTVQPDDWEKLRPQWEYSHAAGAALQVLGFALLVIAILSRDQRR